MQDQSTLESTDIWWDAMGRMKDEGKWPKGVSGNPAGLPKGTKQRRTILREALMANPKFAKLDPIEFMLEILSDPSYGLSNRKWAAKEVAPYVRSKMPIKVETGPPADDIAAQLRQELAAMNAVTTGQDVQEQPTRRRVQLLEDI